MNLYLTPADEAAEALKDHIATMPEWRPAVEATEPRRRSICFARIVFEEGLKTLSRAAAHAKAENL